MRKQMQKTRLKNGKKGKEEGSERGRGGRGGEELEMMTEKFLFYLNARFREAWQERWHA